MKPHRTFALLFGIELTIDARHRTGVRTSPSTLNVRAPRATSYSTVCAGVTAPYEMPFTYTVPCLNSTLSPLTVAVPCSPFSTAPAHP